MNKEVILFWINNPEIESAVVNAYQEYDDEGQYFWIYEFEAIKIYKDKFVDFLKKNCKKSNDWSSYLDTGVLYVWDRCSRLDIPMNGSEVDFSDEEYIKQLIEIAEDNNFTIDTDNCENCFLSDWSSNYIKVGLAGSETGKIKLKRPTPKELDRQIVEEYESLIDLAEQYKKVI